MSSWFLGQTDYISFVYGLASVGLGVVSYLLSRDVKQRLAWIWLALFGFAHGVHEWLDLLVPVWQEPLWIRACRWGLLAASFLFLAEFGRLSLFRQRGRGPGRWLLGILALLGCLGALSGWNGLGATTRQALGLIGGLAAGLALGGEARRNDLPGRAWLIGGGIGFILYALAPGLAAPPASFFQAAVLNFQAFTSLTGLPVGLPQAFLAVVIIAMTLGYLRATWPADLFKSRRYRIRYLYGIISTLVVILAAGWILTQFLGNLALEQVRNDTLCRSNLIIQRLTFELEEAEAAARAMSGSPWLGPALWSKSRRTLAQANSVLDRYQMRFGASPAYLLDRTGTTIASSNRNTPESFVGHNFAIGPYFQQAMKGLPGRYFALGLLTKKPGFFAAFPVYDPAGKIAGVAAITNRLILFQQGLGESDPAFLIDPDGVIFLSSRSSRDHQSLCPVRPLNKLEKSQFSIDQLKPVFSRVLADGTEVKLEGKTYLFYRQYINTPATSGWSIVLLAPNSQVVFYRLLGIAATFILVVFTLLAAGSNLFIREGANRIVASEARFRAMFAAAPEAVFVFDTNTLKILDANPFMAQWLGYSQEELLNLKIDQLLTAESLNEEGRWQCSAGLKPTSCHRYRRKDGSLVDVECTAANLLYGNQVRELVFVRDITERKRAEEALRDSEEKYRRLMETANDAIFTADLKTGIIVDANRKAAELLGRPPENLIGLHYSQLFSPEDAERYRDMFRRRALKGGLIEGEIQVVDTAGRRIPMEINSSRVKVGGRHLVTGIFRDISERKRAEEEKARLEAQLVQAQKIEAIGTLAGGIAHDFNNLLTAIMGNISLAILDQQEKSPSRERLTTAEKACLQAQKLAQQLLTFAKGGVPIKELICFEKLISESASFAAIGSQVRCEFSFPDSLWAAEADPGQIGQVFRNLVINAIQAMPAGGTIKVRGENLEVGRQSDLPLRAGRYVKIAVQDQGIGIPPNYLPKIFDPYFTTKQTGSGLGLATVYSIVKNHGGHIAVESSLGGGTTFQIYLPAVSREINQRPEEKPQILSGQGKILVMDDEEIVRDLLDKMLGHLGYRATLAKDGAEALELFTAAREAGENFAALILDLTVPGGMGGKAAIEQFLKIDPQIKAIVSSGYSDDPIMAEFAKNGFSGVITKPYRIAELSRVLSQVLANHYPAS